MKREPDLVNQFLFGLMLLAVPVLWWDVWVGVQLLQLNAPVDSLRGHLVLVGGCTSWEFTPPAPLTMSVLQREVNVGHSRMSRQEFDLSHGEHRF